MSKSLEPANMVHGKRYCANVIKLTILKWGDHPGLAECVLSIITMSLQVKEGNRKVIAVI